MQPGGFCLLLLSPVSRGGCRILCCLVGRAHTYLQLQVCTLLMRSQGWLTERGHEHYETMTMPLVRPQGCPRRA